MSLILIAERDREWYPKVWSNDFCPDHEDGKHLCELPVFTLKCKCGKEPNFKALEEFYKVEALEKYDAND